MEKLQEVEYFLDDSDEWMTNISLVKSPAIESNFQYFNKEYLEFAADDEKHIIVGAVLIPNKKMLRIDKETQQQYYAYFSKETIAEAAHRFLFEQKNKCFNLEHFTDAKGVSIIESWVKEDENDKSNLYNLNCPIGTWFIMAKITDNTTWQAIKQGEYQGFSVEGLFNRKINSEDELDKTTKNFLSEFYEIAKYYI